MVAEIAREAGILTVGVVTKPFGFEGRRRMTQAEQGIEELRSKVDSLVIIPNERLKYATDQKITFANAFEIADDVLRQAVQSISDLIRDTGFINLDFADVTAIMKDAGLAHMGVGRAAGKGKAEEAGRMAISSPLLETSINGARGVLINVTGSMDIGLEEVEQAASLVQDAVHPDALTIFGATFDETLEDEIRVTVIATGFDEEQQAANAVDIYVAIECESLLLRYRNWVVFFSLLNYIQAITITRFICKVTNGIPKPVLVRDCLSERQYGGNSCITIIAKWMNPY